MGRLSVHFSIRDVDPVQVLLVVGPYDPPFRNIQLSFRAPEAWQQTLTISYIQEHIMKDCTIRLIAYSLIALFAIGEFILGVITAATQTNAIPLYIGLVLAILTLFAILLLLIFNDCAKGNSFLAKLKVHAIVLAVIAQAWFPMTIMYTAEATVDCRHASYFDTPRCRLPIPGAIFGYLLTAIATAICLFNFYRGQEYDHSATRGLSQAAARGPIHLPSNDVEQQPLIQPAQPTEVY
ncbi:hypothetical protein EIP91_008317 [Steccherinum ochraceum]|uniref:MARVEL domain-containing protein n=1 Tax=Steccherinum ochraceum TaxID=92696 RepID=A0A4R0S0C3_9APHY|nr:hypothetical protein EIP91_008317 [Steccherinum ochraceum]